MAASQVISLGIGSPAGISPFINFGLGAGASVAGDSYLISLGLGSPAAIKEFITFGLEMPGGGSDTTPDAFTFTDQSSVALSTVCTSAPVTITGINAPSPITVSGGTYSINGGAFTSSAGSVNNLDTVQARNTSSGSYSTAVNTLVTIGGVSDTFTSTTTNGFPVLLGSINNIGEPYSTGTHTADLSVYFSGATSYSISPSVGAGWSFNTGTGVITIDTSVANTFGPYTVTATNAQGSTASNAFQVVVGSSTSNQFAIRREFSFKL